MGELSVQYESVCSHIEGNAFYCHLALLYSKPTSTEGVSSECYTKWQ